MKKKKEEEKGFKDIGPTTSETAEWINDYYKRQIPAQKRPGEWDVWSLN